MREFVLSCCFNRKDEITVNSKAGFIILKCYSETNDIALDKQKCKELIKVLEKLAQD